MSDQSSRPPDQHISDDDVLSSLTINIDKNGDLHYDADWIPEKDGQWGIAVILYMLIAEDFGSRIFQELKESNEATKNSVEEILMGLLAEGDNNVDKSGIVVPPDVIIDI